MTIDNKVYPVKFTTAQATTVSSRQNGYGEFKVSANSDTEAVEIANAALLEADRGLDGNYILEQEIRLSTGWHTFSSGVLDPAARSESKLRLTSPDHTLYLLEDRI